MNESDLVPYACVASIGTGPVLVLAPHPDDEALGCGGAILSHIEQGSAVQVVIVTDGGKGIPGSKLTPEEIRRLRQGESEAAAKILGYGQPEFWGYPDRELEYGEPLVGRLRSRIGDGNYKSVFAPSPLEVHPDHRVLGMAALEAVRRISQPLELCLYEVGIPLYPNRLLDISLYIETKQRAIACFGSQLACQNYDRQSLGLDVFRTYTLPAEITHAEAYFVMDCKELQADFFSIYERELKPFLKLGVEGEWPVDRAAGGGSSGTDCHEEARRLREENRRLRIERERLREREERLELVLDSLSWKITRPLRVVKGLFFRSTRKR